MRLSLSPAIGKDFHGYYCEGESESMYDVRLTHGRSDDALSRKVREEQEIGRNDIPPLKKIPWANENTCKNTRLLWS